MNSGSSSMEDEQKFAAKTPTLEIFPLSSAPFNFINRNKFFGQPFSSNPNFQLLTGASYVVREIEKSIVSNVDKCLKMMDILRSQNEVLDKIISFPSHLQSCCQIPRRKCQNMYMLSNRNFAAILPGDSVAGVVVTNGILNFLNIYNTLLIVRLVLTWFPNAPPAVVSPLSTLCDPYLNIFRGIIPPLGGTLDLSPILAFLVLNAFQGTAAALPAELPPPEASKDTSSTTIPSHLTASQTKWMKRSARNKSRRENGEY